MGMKYMLESSTEFPSPFSIVHNLRMDPGKLRFMKRGSEPSFISRHFARDVTDHVEVSC